MRGIVHILQAERGNIGSGGKKKERKKKRGQNQKIYQNPRTHTEDLTSVLFITWFVFIFIYFSGFVSTASHSFDPPARKASRTYRISLEHPEHPADQQDSSHPLDPLNYGVLTYIFMGQALTLIDLHMLHACMPVCLSVCLYACLL